MPTPRITLIVAGTNEPSNSHLLAKKFAEGIERAGGSTIIIRLKDLDIDHFNLQCYDTARSIDDQFPMIRAAMETSDGLVIASPIWNFSVPAHLKNLIDRMGSFGLDPQTHSTATMNGKPTFLILTGGAPVVAWPMFKRTTSHISAGLQYFGCSVIGTHFEGGCTLGRGKFGLVVDKRPESLVSIEMKGKAFAELVKDFKISGKLPLWHRIKKSVIQTMQKVKRKMGF